jgi:hypothetical protein
VESKRGSLLELCADSCFGAFLHASNWRELGEPKRAVNSMSWVWVTVGFLFVKLATVIIPDSKAVEGLMRLIGFGLLLGWYFSEGKSQVQYVKEKLGNDYVKKGWATPLLAGLAAFAAYIALAVAIALIAYSPSPNHFATTVKPLILQEWRKHLDLQDASIQKVSITHKGGKVYCGTVDATIGGRSQQFILDVVYDWNMINWSVSPKSDQ